MPSSGAPQPQAIQIQIDDRRRVERQHLADGKAADDRDAERLAQLRAFARIPASAAARRAAPPCVVIRIGRRRSRHASRIATCGGSPRSRSSCSATSIIRMAFFITTPTSRNNAEHRDEAELGVEHLQRQQRADARRRQRRQDGQRVHVALVEHAEHDVDDEQRGEDRDRLVALHLSGTAAALPCSLPWTDAGIASRATARLIDGFGLAQADARLELERDRSSTRTVPSG